MDDFFAIFLAVMIVGAIIGIIVFASFHSDYAAAKRAYQAGLERLKADPHNPALKQEALLLGRRVSEAYDKLRQRNWTSDLVLDELAIMNDIAAATARAGSVPPLPPSPPMAQLFPDDHPGVPPLPNSVQSSSLAGRLAQLDALRSQGAISDLEYQAQRKRILDQV